MSSSNSYNFTVSRDNLITDALLHIGAIGEGETPSANAVTEAARVLNMLVKLRAADGMPLWALKRGFILPFTDASSITTVSHVVTDYITSTLSADEAASQTVLSITDTTGMATGDQFGIELDDGTMQWTTVTVDSSTQGTVATALTGAAASGNRVYAYTASSDRVQRPLRVIEANILDVSSSSSWEIDIEDRSNYYALGNRTSEGTPNRIYYEPSLGSGTADPTSASTWYGTFYVYPRFENGEKIVEFTYHRPFQDFDASTDNPDFPQEFYLPLWLELSALLGPRYGLPIDERRALFLEAKVYLTEALGTIAPEGSLNIQPDFRNA